MSTNIYLYKFGGIFSNSSTGNWERKLKFYDIEKLKQNNFQKLS